MEPARAVTLLCWNPLFEKATGVRALMHILMFNVCLYAKCQLISAVEGFVYFSKAQICVFILGSLQAPSSLYSEAVPLLQSQLDFCLVVLFAKTSFRTVSRALMKTRKNNIFICVTISPDSLLLLYPCTFQKAVNQAVSFLFLLHTVSAVDIM